MVLNPAEFKLHRSLRQAVRRQIASPHSQIRIDSDFRRTINACATSSRAGQNGTWIVPEMVEAYCALHAAGYAHSVETWMDGELVGGLYCVAIGRAVFGESMFASRTDASKIALAALVAFCRTNAVELVDCQQNTRHLASLGAYEMPRTRFLAAVEKASAMPSMVWEFEPLYWNQLIALPQD
jgi:leucyl/phenylalanyl-tRNA--protein transferase